MVMTEKWQKEIQKSEVQKNILITFSWRDCSSHLWWGGVILLVASFVANATSIQSCAKKFALAAILLYLVTSSALNASPLVSSSTLFPNLPLNRRSFESCLFSPSVSRPVSFAASVETNLSSSAPLSRLIISVCLGWASTSVLSPDDMKSSPWTSALISAKSESWNSTSLNCCALFPTWQ